MNFLVNSQWSIVHSSIYRRILLWAMVYGLSASETSAQTKYDFIVAKDGTGNFTTVQEAFNAVPDFRKNITTIFIKNGTYKEKLILAGSKTNVRLIGEDATKTMLTFDDYASRKINLEKKLVPPAQVVFFLLVMVSQLNISPSKIHRGRLVRQWPCV